MSIAVLGPLLVDNGTLRLGSRDRTVLAALVVRSGEACTREELAEAVWGDELPPTWAKALQGCVSRLRKALGRGAIETSPRGYRLQVAADDVDAWRFEQLLGRATELMKLGEVERASYVASQALQLWRGRPLTDLENWEPGTVEARRLCELRLDGEELFVEAALRAGRHREVLANAQAMVDEARLRERRWVLLARAQYQSGRQAEALDSLRSLRRVLSGELGLDPSPGVASLERAILQQDPDLIVTTPATVLSSCPYHGLTPFDEKDADTYFGRESEIARGLEQLCERGVLVIVGPSGCGKSSLARAGIAAGMRRAGHQVQVVTPGPHSMRALGPLPRRGPPPVLVVDQAEEVFTLGTELDERHQFMTALVERAERAPLVLTLRGDRTGEVSGHPELAGLVERGLFLLGAMSQDGLREAIEGPAGQAGLILEPGLVDLLVREVEGEPGALPLLSHSLQETWQRRDGRTLTVAGYQATGGVRGAVSQSAEQLYGLLSPHERRLLRDVMLRLVLPGLEGEPARARLPRRSLVADPAQDSLVDELVAARLLTSHAGVVEMAHESLAQAWPRLRRWLDDDVEGHRILHHLVTAAEVWEDMGRPESELYRGVRLGQVLAWRDQASPELTHVEQAFVAAGAAAAAAEEQQIRERARKQTRLIHRLRLALLAAVTLLVVAVMAGVVAVDQTDEAHRAAREAQAREVGAVALTSNDTSRSLLLSLAAVRLDDAPATRNDLLTTLGRTPELVASTRPVGAGIVRIDVSPDGTRVAAYDRENRVLLFDRNNAEPIESYDTDGEGVQDEQLYPTGPLQFSPSGRVLAVGTQTYDGSPVRLLDGHSLTPLGRQLPEGPTDPSKVVDLTYSSDGRFLAVSFVHDARPAGSEAGGGDDPTSAGVWVWDLNNRARPPWIVPMPVNDRSGGHADVWDMIALSPDGRTLYGSSPATAYDVRTGKVRWTRPDVVSWQPVDLSADGRLLAITSVLEEPGFVAADRAYLLAAGDGRTKTELRGQGGYVSLARFSADGRRVVTVANPQTWVWDTKTGAVLRKLQTASTTAAFSPDGSLLESAGSDGSVHTWDITGEHSFVVRMKENYRRFTSGQVDIAPDGRHAAFEESGIGTAILDLTTGERTGLLRAAAGGSAEQAGAWSPDGKWFATGGRHGLLQVYDADGTLARSARVASGSVTDVVFDPKGNRLAVAASSGEVTLVDAQTMAAATQPIALPGPACCVTLAPDGHTALVLTGEPELQPGEQFGYDHWVLVDLASGAVNREGPLAFDASMASFSPTGHYAAVAGGRSVQVFDTTSGRAVSAPQVQHVDDVTALTWSHGGEQLLSGSDDGRVVLWDGHTGEFLESVVIASPPDAVYPAYTPDGTRLVIGTADGDVYSWDPSLRHAETFACQEAGRDLSTAEWSEAFGDRAYERTCTFD